MQIDISVLDIKSSSERVTEALVERSMLAIQDDNAHVVVLSCARMGRLARAVRSSLLARGYDIPVIDPGIAALKLAEALVDLG
ncbi:MAG TPA: hypothetical protein DCP08_09675 [Chloroflexi bacterium]|nr:hypothetical protein [Chloroflexota bacterium]